LVPAIIISNQRFSNTAYERKNQQVPKKEKAAVFIKKLPLLNI
jgi:hypothetical protein